jgi:hypothetical protein
LNHDYISYSDTKTDSKIRYKWNCGSRSVISLDHTTYCGSVESSCSWVLHRNIHRNKSLFIFSTEKRSFWVTRAIYFSISLTDSRKKRLGYVYIGFIYGYRYLIMNSCTKYFPIDASDILVPPMANKSESWKGTFISSFL